MITFSGITNVPSDHDSNDGDMELLLNLLPAEGALRPITAPDLPPDAAAVREAWSERTHMTVNAVVQVGEMTCIVGDADIVYAVPTSRGTTPDDLVLFRRSDLLYDIEVSQDRQELTEVRVPLTDTLQRQLRQPTALVGGQQGTVAHLFPYDSDDTTATGITLALASIENAIDQTLSNRHSTWHKHVAFGMAVVRLFDGTLLHCSNLFALLPADLTRTVITDLEQQQLISTTYLHTHQVTVTPRSDRYDSDIIGRLVRGVEIYLSPPVSLTVLNAADELVTNSEGIAVRVTFAAADDDHVATLPHRLPLRHVLTISPDHFGTAMALPRATTQGATLDQSDLHRQSVGARVAACHENRLCLGQVSTTLPQAFVPAIRYRYPTHHRLCGLIPDIGGTGESRMADVIVSVSLSIGGQTQTVMHRHQLPYPIAGPLMYPDRRAYAMELWLRLSDTNGEYSHWHHRVRLQPSPTADYALALRSTVGSGRSNGQGVLGSLLWQQVRTLTYDATTDTYLESQALFDRIDEGAFSAAAAMADTTATATTSTNELVTSAPYRPVDLDLSRGVMVGNGAITAFSTNTRRFSGVQFGAYPLLVFTTDGLWALQAASDGAWRSKYLVSQSTTTAPDNILAAGDHVFFWSDEGLLTVSGQRLSTVWQETMMPPARITSQLPGWNAIVGAIFPPDLAAVILSAAEDAARPGKLTGRGQEVYCRLNEHLSLVYTLREGLWGGVLHGAVAQEGLIPVMALTRPLHMGDGHQRKRIARWWCCGTYQGSATAYGSRLSMAVWGSNDLMRWHLVGTSRHHHLTGIYGTPYRHFHVLVAGWMTTEERLKGLLPK